MCIRLLLIGALISLTFAVSAEGDLEEGPLFVKVFAGLSPTSWGSFRRAVTKNLKSKAAIPDSSEIPCDVGRWYALGVIASQPGRQMLFFETTAIFRDLDNYDTPRRSHREHTLNKKEYGTRRFSFKIREGSVDHDTTIVVHIGKKVYLRHKFQIRGCSDNEERAAT